MTTTTSNSTPSQRQHENGQPVPSLVDNCKQDVSEHAHGVKGVRRRQRPVPSNVTRWRLHGDTNGPGQRSASSDSYQVEHDDLFDAIRNNKDYNEADYGASSTMTSILGRMATYSGQEVTMEQALASDLDLHPKVYDFKATPEEAWPDEYWRVWPDKDGRYWTPTPGVGNVLNQ